MPLAQAIQCRIGVVPLLLSPSCVTRKKIAIKKNGRARSLRGEKHARVSPRISRGHFFLAVFFRVTHDGLSE